MLQCALQSIKTLSITEIWWSSLGNIAYGQLSRLQSGRLGKSETIPNLNKRGKFMLGLDDKMTRKILS